MSAQEQTGGVENTAAQSPTVTHRPPRKRRGLGHEVTSFLLVGGIAFVVEVGISNLLVYGIPGLLAPAMPDGPLLARGIATVVAIGVAWVGNRLFTYGHRDTGSNLRGLALFVLVNILSMGLALLPLGVTWYLLGLRDPISYNISANVLGTALAMSFRFFAYRSWVFKERPAPPEAADDAAPSSMNRQPPPGADRETRGGDADER